MDERKKAVIVTGILIGALFFGFVFGVMFTNYNYFRLVESIHIEHLTIDFNESKIVDLVYAKAGFDTQAHSTNGSLNNG